MNERTLFPFICVMMALVCLWLANRHEGVPKLLPVLKVQSYVTDKVKKIQFVSKTQLLHTTDEKERDEVKHEVKTLSLLGMQPYNAYEEKRVPSLPNSLPYAADLKEINDIQQALWITQLYQFLQSLNKSISPQVNMVFGDSNHMDLVLNWIIAAHVRLDPPLHSIMVLSLDQPLCDFLTSKNLPLACIAVPPESFLNNPSQNMSYVQGIKCRFVVLRMINFWGYDVASYDSDAVLLRNPQPMYDKNPDVKLFAGSGTYPNTISKKWGFSLCACVLVVRSHPSTDSLWRHIHKLQRGAEQSILNYALRDLGVRWNRTTTLENICHYQSGWQSYGPLNCMVFSQDDICRGCCKSAKKHNYYILHPVTKKIPMKKPARLKHMYSWFLSDNWKKINSSSSTGTAWLRKVSTLRHM